MRSKVGVCVVLSALVWSANNIAADAPPTMVSPAAPLKPVALPDDVNKPLLLRACAVCHHIELVVQRKRPVEDWERQVARMVGFGAVATEAEQDRIIDYLERWFSLSP